MNESQNNENNSQFKTLKVSFISISHFINDNYQAFIPPILPLLIEKFNMTMFMSGLLLFFMRFPSILNPAVGVYADKMRIKSFIVAAPLVTVASICLVVVVPAYAYVVILLLVSGIASAFYHVPAPVLIRRYSGRKIGTGMSFFMLGGELARTTGPLIILWAVAVWGFEGAWRIAVPGILLTAALGFFIKDVPMQSVNTGIRKRDMLLSTLKGLRKIYIIIAGLVFGKAFLQVALTSFLPVYMTDKGVNLWLAGASLALLELAGAAGAFLAGPVADKIGRKRLLMFVFIVSPVLMLVFILTDGWISAPLLILLGLLIFSATPVFLAIVQDMEPDFHASANSVYMTINFVIASVVVFFIGWLGDIIPLKTVYLICTAISVAGIPFAAALPSNK